MEKANGVDSAGSSIRRGSDLSEAACAHGHYTVQCFNPEGVLKWEDRIENIVTTEGKNALLSSGFKGSAFTQTAYLGLINGSDYTAVAASNTAADITTGATTAPANGWNEVAASTVAARGVPAFGVATAGALALASPLSFSVLAADTIKGCFLLLKSVAGAAPTSTVGSTSGALYSAGLFSGGDKVVGVDDILNVSYTASL